MVACLAAAVGEWERAARWFGAVYAQAKMVGLNFPIPEQRRFERTAVDARVALGDAAFDAAWTAGRTLSREQSTTEAATWLIAVPAPLKAPKPDDPAVRVGLTAREFEVLRLLAAGHSNPQIAAALFIERRTVTSHITNIFAKLGVASRTEAAAYAIRNGLV
jgi:DNA-binding NarL/FixJ family response regulator